MYTAKNISTRIILYFAWKTLLFFFLYASGVCMLYTYGGWKFIALPFLPIGLIGTAVAFYLGFKNNSSYERLWEGRKIWGSIVNASRTFGLYLEMYLQIPDQGSQLELMDIKKELTYRHIAWINALRIRLRSRPTWEIKNQAAESIVEAETSFRKEVDIENAFLKLKQEEKSRVIRNKNPLTQLLIQQGVHLKHLKEKGYLENLPLYEFGKLISELYAQQGACERIKSFPFPRQYAYFSKIFVWIFIVILPFGMLTEFGKIGYVWVTIPFYVLIAWVFNTMEIVGDTSENPFDNGINDVPISAISRNIEIDLLEMIQEDDIPEPITSINNILM